MSIYEDMTQLQCPTCFIGYAIPNRMHQANVDGTTKDGWYCPNGHHLIIRESQVDKLRRERDRAKQDVAFWEDQWRETKDQKEAAERSASAYKGQVTKLKRRAKAGMCPCCKRSFVNLAQHMATKHPDMDPEEPLTVIEGGKV